MSFYRLDKYLADAGIGTRKEVKTYIKRGGVRVNDAIVCKSDLKIDPETDIIYYGNQKVCLSAFEYYILNKPVGYVSATKDNTAPTVLSLINSHRKDLFPVGRLDKDTEGLLLITNDGDLAHRLLSPKHHVNKTYYAVIEGIIDETDIAAFRRGLKIGDDDFETALPAELKLYQDPDFGQNLSYIEVTIQEGKFHQIKRMFRAVGKRVIYLRRIHFGSLSLPDDLFPGHYRKLTDAELKSLRECC